MISLLCILYCPYSVHLKIRNRYSYAEVGCSPMELADSQIVASYLHIALIISNSICPFILCNIQKILKILDKQSGPGTKRIWSAGVICWKLLALSSQGRQILKEIQA